MAEGGETDGHRVHQRTQQKEGRGDDDPEDQVGDPLPVLLPAPDQPQNPPRPGQNNDRQEGQGKEFFPGVEYPDEVEHLGVGRVDEHGDDPVGQKEKAQGVDEEKPERHLLEACGKEKEEESGPQTEEEGVGVAEAD